MNRFERLREVRDQIVDMIEDPMHGYGAEIDSRGIDLTEQVADFTFDLPVKSERYEIQIRRL